MDKIWGKLIPVGGDDNDISAITEMALMEEMNYFGRMAKNPLQQNQFILPKAYVSATHFSFQLLKNDDASRSKYSLRDYSTNGSFVNGELVGRDKEKEITHNDMISIRLKGVDKLMFKFQEIIPVKPPLIKEISKSTASSPLKKMPESIVAHTDTSKSHNLSRNKVKEMKPPPSIELDRESDILAKQVATLQQENQNQEQRISTILMKLESSRQELSQLQKEQRALKTIISSKDTEIEDLKSHCSAVEAASSATGARTQVLESSLADKIAELEEAKTSISSLQEELQHKSNQLDSRSKMLDDANTTLSLERGRRQRLEETCQQLQGTLKEVQLQETKLNTVNQALRGAVAEGDRRLLRSQARLKSLKDSLQSSQTLQKQQDTRILTLFASLQELATTFTSTLTDTSSDFQTTQLQLSEININHMNILHQNNNSGNNSSSNSNTEQSLFEAEEGSLQDEIRDVLGFLDHQKSSTATSTAPAAESSHVNASETANQTVKVSSKIKQDPQAVVERLQDLDEAEVLPGQSECPKDNVYNFTQTNNSPDPQHTHSRSHSHHNPSSHPQRLFDSRNKTTSTPTSTSTTPAPTASSSSYHPSHHKRKLPELSEALEDYNNANTDHYNNPDPPLRISVPLNDETQFEAPDRYNNNDNNNDNNNNDPDSTYPIMTNENIPSLFPSSSSNNQAACNNNNPFIFAGNISGYFSSTKPLQDIPFNMEMEMGSPCDIDREKDGTCFYQHNIQINDNGDSRNIAYDNTCYEEIKEEDGESESSSSYVEDEQKRKRRKTRKDEVQNGKAKDLEEFSDISAVAELEEQEEEEETGFRGSGESSTPPIN